MIRARPGLTHLAAAALLLASFWVLWAELRPPPTGAAPPRHAIRIASQALPGAGTRIGPFRLVGAAALTSPDPAFGGLSGLAALPDGRLLAITDAGDWVVLTPGRVGAAPVGALGSIAMPGRDKADRDAEAVVLTPDGRTRVSLEQQHRILSFAGHGPPVTPVGAPLFRTDAMAWPPNGGGESLAALPDGSLVWISENARSADGALTALLITAGGTRSIGIAALDGFSPTDAVAVDAAHLLLLHRRYNGVESAAALSLVDLSPVLAGGSGAPARLLARWGKGDGWPIDNMEGLALVRRPGTAPLLYLVSDNNFSPAQRTLLLRLEVTSPLVPAASR
ncbi:MAG: esterase-like activity of phytase family protein [Sphingomonadales bacterium]|jgi:hypothetical protein